MQLFSRNKALAALSLGALAALGACGDDVTVPAPVNPPVQVTISPSNANVNVGAFVDLAVAITGGTTTPTLQSCSTSSAAVATTAVQGGNACRVTGVSTGAVTITATTSAGQTAAASVTVNAPAPAISGIAISPAAQNIQVGGTFTITANPTTQAPGANVARNFVSSNTAVATVNATTGVVTAVAPGQATVTVTLTGTGTGLSQAVVTGQVAVTVTALPPSVTAVNATPTSATLITGATQQITATATYATGITGTITYGTSNPGVATVNGTGLITAVGPGQAVITVTASSAGNASFAAASATQQIPVTVNAPAQVSIANITSGTQNTPVDINNVNGQIQVLLNLVTNNNNVSSVSLYVCDAGQNCTATAQPAAQQSFGTAGAADGQINLFINTADFTVTSDFSSATAKFLNGQKNLIAVLNVANSNANSNLAILNFNNTDNFAARHVAPTRAVVNTTTNLTWWGGPGAEGRGTITVVPVMYTPNRTVARVSVNVTGTACDNTPYTFVSGTDARPWTITYGAFTAPTGAERACAATSTTSPNTNDLGVAVASAIDNSQNPVTIPALFATTSSSSPAVTAPAVIRGDYYAPTFTVAAPANRWASIASNYSFRTNTTSIDDSQGANRTGVGASNVSTFSYTYAGCGSTTAVAFDATSATIPECPYTTNSTNTAYTVTATGTDLLGNSRSATTGTSFGIDNTPPSFRYLSTTDSLTIYTSAPVAGAAADTMFATEALDDRSGFDATAAEHLLARANQAAQSCLVTAAASAGTNFVTAPNCAFGSHTFSATTLPSGFRLLDAITFNSAPISGTEGYYTYRARIQDRAGNVVTLPFRTALINTTAPAITGLGLPGTITAAGPNTFTPNFTEVVEAWFTNFRVSYNGLTLADGTTEASLLFPATAVETNTAATQFGRWNDVIYPNGNVTIGTPFSSGVNFYTNLEITNVDGTINGTLVAGTNLLRPDSVGARVGNVGGLVSNYALMGGQYAVALLDGNIATDATRWSAKTQAANLLTFRIGGDAAAFNAPANGAKAIATSTTNQINSPFARVDFYRQEAGNWRFIGWVNGNATPNVADGPVYIADNGNTRVWTYRLATAQCDSVSVSCTPAAIAAQAGQNIIAIGTTATAGRALVTSVSASLVNATNGISSWTANPVFGYAAVNVAAAASSGPQAVTTQPTLATNPTYGTTAVAPTYSCTTSDAAIATCSINASTGALTVNGIAAGNATITVIATSPASTGFIGATAQTTVAVTVTP